MNSFQSFSFKRGSEYSRDDIHFLYHGKPVPRVGTGSIVNFQDGVQTKQGPAIRLVINCSEAKEILNYSVPQNKTETKEEILVANNNVKEPSSSFLLEKHLESYIEKFWDETIFGKDFDIYENGRQFPTETGPLDLLAQKKDKSEFLVLELKRDKTSDVAVAQTLRYMGYIKKELATNDEKVKGCIIGTQEDRNLVNAISMVPEIDFYRYNINFSLNRVEF